MSDRGVELMGLSSAEWEELLPCPKCKKDTTFFINQWDDLNDMVTSGICSVCETEIEKETKWVEVK
tara:strand:+ start:240 stop:437 length:198 start_codon:yes stop_codon:yes gene_type:complete